MSTREELYGNDYAADGPDRPEPYEYADLDPTHPDAYQHGAPAHTDCPECGHATVIDGTRGIRKCPWCWWAEAAGTRTP